MARKPLLTEAEVRSFMKLANLSPIGNVKLQELGYGSDIPAAEEEEEEDELEVTGPMGAVDDADLDDPLDPVDDVPVDDIGDEPLDGMAADGIESEGVEDKFMDLVTQLADLLKIDVEMDNGAEAAVDDDIEGIDAMDAEDEPLPGEPEGGDIAMASDEEEEEDEDVLGNMGGGVYESKEAIVSEVARRVASRLKAENSKQTLAAELTEKIFNRLVKNG